MKINLDTLGDSPQLYPRAFLHANRVLRAEEVTALICGVHDRRESRVTPKYFADVVNSTGRLLMRRRREIDHLVLLVNKTI